MTYRPTAWIVGLALVVAAFLIVPSLIAIPASFTDRTYLSLPEHTFSLQHYKRFAADQAWRRSFMLSAGTALTAATIATVLGTAFSIGLWGIAGRWIGLLKGMVLLPLAIPGIVAALAMYLLWTKLGLYDTVTGVILVQVAVGLPFVVIVTSAALAMLDATQVKASRSLGAGPWRTLRRVVLPSIRESILAGFVLALVSGWDESVITLFVTGRNVQVLPRKIWDSLRYDIDPIVAVVATLMLALTLAGVLVFLLFSKRGGGRPEAG
ncbi:MAG: ABC transporter permease [Rhizobiaceae bacterium]|nr:ABC transporter permease [Rhizobiaceae bacterium]